MTFHASDRSNSRIQVFDPDGKFNTKWTDVGQPWALVGKTPAHNMAVDSTGAIYVAEIKNWRVQKFAPR